MPHLTLPKTPFTAFAQLHFPRYPALTKIPAVDSQILTL